MQMHLVKKRVSKESCILPPHIEKNVKYSHDRYFISREQVASPQMSISWVNIKL